MTRQYEVVYIFDSALEETAINERLTRFHSLIQKEGIEPPQVSHWGKRTLAYPVKKHETPSSMQRPLPCPSSSVPSSWMKACFASSSWSARARSQSR
jgi:hypothetical protein